MVPDLTKIFRLLQAPLSDQQHVVMLMRKISPRLDASLPAVHQFLLAHKTALALHEAYVSLVQEQALQAKRRKGRAAFELDVAIDKHLRLLVEILHTYIQTADIFDRHAESKSLQRMMRRLFPQGMVAHTHLPFPEEYVATKQLLEQCQLPEFAFVVQREDIHNLLEHMK